MPKSENLVGQVFHRLTVISKDVEASKKPACGEGVVRTRKFRRKYVCR